MVLLQGPLVTWCSRYLQQHNNARQDPSLAADSVVDYIKFFALPSEISVVRALLRQVIYKRLQLRKNLANVCVLFSWRTHFIFVSRMRISFFLQLQYWNSVYFI
jgi:hypothetical protein